MRKFAMMSFPTRIMLLGDMCCSYWGTCVAFIGEGGSQSFIDYHSFAFCLPRLPQVPFIARFVK
jgi:hypothetical protein